MPAARPARQAHALSDRLGPAWAALPAVRRGRVAAADSMRLFSRAGPALADTLELLVELCHPEAQPYGFVARGELVPLPQPAAGGPGTGPAGGGAAGGAAAGGVQAGEGQRELRPA